MAGAAIIGFVAIIFRESILRYMSGRMDRQNSERLASLQAAYERTNAQLQGLQKIVSDASIFRSQRLIEKQVEASDFLWSAFCENKKCQRAAEMMKTLNVDYIDASFQTLTESNRDGKMMEAIGVLSRSATENEANDQPNRQQNFILAKSPDEVRPFVSPMAWALFTAHHTIVNHAIVTFKLWSIGVQTQKILKTKELEELVCRALPHQKNGFIEFGHSFAYFCLGEIEECLEREIRRFLKEGDIEQQSFQRASEILASAQALQSMDEKREAQLS